MNEQCYRFKKRDIVVGTQLSHIEVTLLHTRIVIREENVMELD